MPFTLTARDRATLSGVHPDLVRVFERAAEISPIQFRIIEGVRTLARQRQLKAAGASKTLNSRHLTGHAIDVAVLIGGKITWDWPLYDRLARYIKQAARDVGVSIEWGGDWRWRDGPHWQLPWSRYPIQVASLATDSDMEAVWLEVQEDGRMETPTITPNAARMGVEGASVLGGAGLITDAATQLQQAESHFSAGTIIGLLIGGLVVLGAAVSIYDRWDAAGRPLPGFLKRVFA